MSFGVNLDIKRDDSYLKNLRKKLQKLTKTKGEVGFFEDEVYSENGSDRNGVPVATIAYANNYGVEMTGDIPVPMRPFFTLATEELSRTFHFDIRDTILNVLTNNRDSNSEFKSYLQGFRESIKSEIRLTRVPPNAKKTVQLKGKNDPLVETGKMLDSVDYRIVRK